MLHLHQHTPRGVNTALVVALGAVSSFACTSFKVETGCLDSTKATAVSVSGEGFEEKVAYQCRFTVFKGTNVYSSTSPATVVNSSHMSCLHTVTYAKDSKTTKFRFLPDRRPIATANTQVTGVATHYENFGWTKEKWR